MQPEGMQEQDLSVKKKTSTKSIHKNQLRVRSNSIKEIEAWARAGHEKTNIGRSSGQIPENITEERMLQTRLWELSKERHKFKSQNEYEKKIFLERQQRKSAIFRNMIRELTGKKTFSAVDKNHFRTDNHSSGGAAFFCAGQTSAELKLTGTHTSSDKGNGQVISIPQIANKGYIRPQTVPTSMFLRQPTIDVPEKEADSVFATEPELPVRTSQINAGKTVSSGPCLPQIHNHSNHTGTIESRQTQLLSLASSNSPPSHKHGAMKKCSVVDERYTHLQNSLSENYQARGGAGVNIPRLVKGMDCLHIPPRSSKDGKPKMTHKMVQFMIEKGIVF